MAYTSLNVDNMVQEGVFWTMGEYPYFVIMSSYIISKDTVLMDINNGYINHGVRWRVEKNARKTGKINVKKSMWNILRIFCLYVRRNLRRS